LLRELHQTKAYYHDAQKFIENQPLEGSLEDFFKQFMYRMNIAPHH
jgi:hypothetical protein